MNGGVGSGVPLTSAVSPHSPAAAGARGCGGPTPASDWLQSIVDPKNWTTEMGYYR